MHHQPIEPCSCIYCHPRRRDRIDWLGLSAVAALGGIWAFCVIVGLTHIHQVGF